ncbi:hypothetical protein U3516DRAFT_802552 [Neocallimastix sp. 'constans']
MKNWLNMEKVEDNDERFGFILAGTVDILMNKYRQNEDEKFRTLKTSTIYTNESIRDINDRYLNPYNQQSTKNKAKLSVHDYENSIRSRPEIYESVAYEEPTTIEDACEIAEKMERIKAESRSLQRNKRNNNNSFMNNTNYCINNAILKKLNAYHNRNNTRNFNNTHNNNNIDDITKKMENLHINFCYWCNEPGHIVRYCPHRMYQQTNQY